MNDYSEMLQALADKFGTTVEHLWSVMLTQAPISATINLLVIIGWAAISIWGFLLIQKKTTEPEGGAEWPEDGYQSAEWKEEGAVLAWVLWAIIALATVLIGGAELENIITGYVNPEFWALMKLKG